MFKTIAALAIAALAVLAGQHVTAQFEGMMANHTRQVDAVAHAR